MARTAGMNLELAGEEIRGFRQHEVIASDPDNAAVAFQIRERAVELVEIPSMEAEGTHD